MKMARGGGAERDEGNRRAELLRAAARLFREKGYAATTIRDIAAAVGMRAGSPFYHFKSKQDLLKAVMEEGLATALESLSLAVSGRHEPLQAFRALVRAHLQIVVEQRVDFIPVLLHEWRALSEEGRAEVVAIKDRYEAVWQDVLTDLKRQGLLGGDDKLTRLFMLGALNWVAQWYRPDGELDLDEIAGRAVDFLLRGSAPRR